jgi:hypothetical protein
VVSCPQWPVGHPICRSIDRQTPSIPMWTGCASEARL